MDEQQHQDTPQDPAGLPRGSSDKLDKDTLQAEIIALQIKADEYLNGWKRAKADYENLKKETEKDRLTYVKFGMMALLTKLLDAYSNLKLAWNFVPPERINESWVSGFGHIKKQMWDILESEGVQEIPAEAGAAFDPALHEAVAGSDGDTKDPTHSSSLQDQDVEGEAQHSQPIETPVIVKEIKPGFTFHGQVICPAKVVISNKS